MRCRRPRTTIRRLWWACSGAGNHQLCDDHAELVTRTICSWTFSLCLAGQGAELLSIGGGIVDEEAMDGFVSALEQPLYLSLDRWHCLGWGLEASKFSLQFLAIDRTEQLLDPQEVTAARGLWPLSGEDRDL